MSNKWIQEIREKLKELTMEERWNLLFLDEWTKDNPEKIEKRKDAIFEMLLDKVKTKNEETK